MVAFVAACAFACRWTKSLVTKLAAGEQLTIRLQGPYADPPVNLGQPDAVVLVAGMQLRLDTINPTTLRAALGTCLTDSVGWTGCPSEVPQALADVEGLAIQLCLPCQYAPQTTAVW